MKISIVIPAFNEERLLGETLQHVRRASNEFMARGWETEWIVCDNNSTDQTAAVARAGGAKVVFEPVNQIGRARNCGAAAAAGDWLIFIDADSKPSPELFREVAQHIQTGQCLAGGSTVRLDGDYLLGRSIVTLWNLISVGMNWVAGSFIFCEAAAFRKIGGFNLELFASEELDLSRRLKVLAKESGKKIIIANQHPLVTSARKFHLYTLREHLWFLARTVATFGRTLNNRDACHTWYDGKR